MILAPDNISTPGITSQESQDTPNFSPTAANLSNSHNIQAGQANRVLSWKEWVRSLDPEVTTDQTKVLESADPEWRDSCVSDAIIASNAAWLEGNGNVSPFRAGINTEVIGKCGADKLSYSGAFQLASLTMCLLAEHIAQGHPWMPGLLGGNGKRWQSNVTGADVLGADIDDGLTIEQALAHPFIQSHAGLLIESSSSTPEHHKFRLVFRLLQPVEDWQNVRICNRYLIHVLGTADPACKDASRFFFGGRGREPRLLNESATLPEHFVADALAWHEVEEANAKAQRAIRAKQAERWLAENGEEAQLELVQSALDAIAPYAPGEGRYNDLSVALAGLCNDLGTAGEQLALAWDGGRGQWGRPFETWLQSLLRSNSGTAGLGSLFWLAKQEGWQRPEKFKAAQFKVETARIPLAEAITSADAERARVLAAQTQEDALNQVLKRFSRLEKKANAGLQDPDFKPDPSPPDRPDHVFSPGARKTAIAHALKLGKRYILDISGTGAGKSTTIGQVIAGDFETEKIWYLTAESRKSSTPEIEQNYTVLPVRHGGMKHDETERTPLGKAVVRRPKAGERSDIEANCIQPDLFRLYAERGIDVHGEGNPICLGCPQKNLCKVLPGHFKKDRQTALGQRLITAHPQSLNSAEGYDYADDLLTWEEAGQLFPFRQQMSVTEAELLQSLGAIADDHPDLQRKISPLTKALRALMGREQPDRYGWSDKALSEALPPMTAPEIEALIADVEDYYTSLDDHQFLEAHTRADVAEYSKLITRLRGKIERRQQHLDRLSVALMIANDAITRYELAPLQMHPPTAQQLNEAEKLPADIRRLDTELCDLQRELDGAELARERVKDAARDIQSEERAEKHRQLAASVQKRWLVHFLKALHRERGYSFRLQIGILTISYPENRYRAIAQSAKANLFLDATLSRERLAQRLGVDPAEIHVIQQQGTERHCPENLEIVQIVDRGKFGRQRSEALKGSIAALTEEIQRRHPGARTIDFKSVGSKFYWFRDNRGSNEFAEDEALILIGTPTPNIAALQADYMALTGDRDCYKGNPRWEAFVKEAIDNELWQTIGRLRAQLSPQTKKTIYLLSDHELPTAMRAKQVSAADISLAAGTPAQQQWHTIHEFCRAQFDKLGTLPTQSQVSAALGIVQGQISKLAKRFVGGWRQLLKIFQSLIEPYIADGIFSQMPESQQQQALEHTQVLEAIATDPPDPGGGFIEFLLELHECLGNRAFVIAASQMTPISRGQLITNLLVSADIG